MAGVILHDIHGNQLIPKTYTTCVYDENGKSLQDLIDSGELGDDGSGSSTTGTYFDIEEWQVYTADVEVSEFFVTGIDESKTIYIHLEGLDLIKDVDYTIDKTTGQVNLLNHTMATGDSVYYKILGSTENVVTYDAAADVSTGDAVTLTDTNGDVIIPKTLVSAIQDDDGNSLQDLLDKASGGASSEDVDVSIEEHNTSTTAHADLREKTDIIQTTGTNTSVLASDGKYYEIDDILPDDVVRYSDSASGDSTSTEKVPFEFTIFDEWTLVEQNCYTIGDEFFISVRVITTQEANLGDNQNIGIGYCSRTLDMPYLCHATADVSMDEEATDNIGWIHPVVAYIKENGQLRLGTGFYEYPYQVWIQGRGRLASS